MKIVLYGTPVLRKVSKKVEKIDNELNETIGMSRVKRDLFESRLNSDISVQIEQME